MDRASYVGRALVALVLVAFTGVAFAQSTLQEIKRTPASASAVAHAKRGFISATPKGSLPAGAIRTDLGEGGRGGGHGGTTQNPGDLTYQGGAVMPYATQHNVYLFPNGSVCTDPSCWGSIAQFQRDLNQSNMIHITDQYVGADDNNRYPTARTQFALHYALPANPLVDADMAEVA